MGQNRGSFVDQRTINEQAFNSLYRAPAMRQKGSNGNGNGDGAGAGGDHPARTGKDTPGGNESGGGGNFPNKTNANLNDGGLGWNNGEKEQAVVQQEQAPIYNRGPDGGETHPQQQQHGNPSQHRGGGGPHVRNQRPPRVPVPRWANGEDRGVYRPQYNEGRPRNYSGQTQPPQSAVSWEKEPPYQIEKRDDWPQDTKLAGNELARQSQDLARKGNTENQPQQHQHQSGNVYGGMAGSRPGRGAYNNPRGGHQSGGRGNKSRNSNKFPMRRSRDNGENQRTPSGQQQQKQQFPVAQDTPVTLTEEEKAQEPPMDLKCDTTPNDSIVAQDLAGTLAPQPAEASAAIPKSGAEETRPATDVNGHAENASAKAMTGVEIEKVSEGAVEQTSRIPSQAADAKTQVPADDATLSAAASSEDKARGSALDTGEGSSASDDEASESASCSSGSSDHTALLPASRKEEADAVDHSEADVPAEQLTPKGEKRAISPAPVAASNVVKPMKEQAEKNMAPSSLDVRHQKAAGQQQDTHSSRGETNLLKADAKFSDQQAHDVQVQPVSTTSSHHHSLNHRAANESTAEMSRRLSTSVPIHTTPIALPQQQQHPHLRQQQQHHQHYHGERGERKGADALWARAVLAPEFRPSRNGSTSSSRDSSIPHLRDFPEPPHNTGYGSHRAAAEQATGYSRQDFPRSQQTAAHQGQAFSGTSGTAGHFQARGSADSEYRAHNAAHQAWHASSRIAASTQSQILADSGAQQHHVGYPQQMPTPGALPLAPQQPPIQGPLPTVASGNNSASHNVVIFPGMTSATGATAQPAQAAYAAAAAAAASGYPLVPPVPPTSAAAGIAPYPLPATPAVSSSAAAAPASAAYPLYPATTSSYYPYATSVSPVAVPGASLLWPPQQASAAGGIFPPPAIPQPPYPMVAAPPIQFAPPPPGFALMVQFVLVPVGGNVQHAYDGGD